MDGVTSASKEVPTHSQLSQELAFIWQCFENPKFFKDMKAGASCLILLSDYDLLPSTRKCEGRCRFFCTHFQEFLGALSA